MVNLYNVNHFIKVETTEEGVIPPGEAGQTPQPPQAPSAEGTEIKQETKKQKKGKPTVSFTRKKI